jgi:hypothetical protein
MYKYCPKCRTSEYKSDVGAWVKYEDHAAQIESLMGQIKSLKGMIDEILSTDSSTGDRIFP